MKSSKTSLTLVLTLAFAALALALVLSQPASAQTETILYNFCSDTGCADGANPTGGLIADTAGNLYGNTIYGGASTAGWVGGGAVFKLTPSGDESVLYAFHNGVHLDGYWPAGTLTMDAQGNLYGTTERGGAHSIHVPRGDGTAFKISRDGTETILHSFGSFNSDGVEPLGGMVVDAKGNVYGTTFFGGVNIVGTVFKLNAKGAETVLHNFAENGVDGYYPSTSPIMDKNGSLYGTTGSGGSRGGGTVFEITAAGSYSVLHNFDGAQGDGIVPLASLTLDSHGNLYGTTYRGGAYDTNQNGGTVFKLSPGSNGSWNETILYNFGQESGSCQEPWSNVVLDAKGNLYGTTSYGGPSGGGCLFEISPAGRFTVLHAFGQGTDGVGPTGNLVFYQGNLYGTAAGGGAYGEGAVFKYTPAE